MTNPLEGKRQMAIRVSDAVYLFDVTEDRKGMIHKISDEWNVTVLFKIASYNVTLNKGATIIKEANIDFPVLSDEAMLFLNGQAKVTKGHLDSIPHLGAIVDYFQEVYEHEAKTMQVLPS